MSERTPVYAAPLLQKMAALHPNMEGSKTLESELERVLRRWLLEIDRVVTLHKSITASNGAAVGTTAALSAPHFVVHVASTGSGAAPKLPCTQPTALAGCMQGTHRAADASVWILQCEELLSALHAFLVFTRHTRWHAVPGRVTPAAWERIIASQLISATSDALHIIRVPRTPSAASNKYPHPSHPDIRAPSEARSSPSISSVTFPASAGQAPRPTPPSPRTAPGMPLAAANEADPDLLHVSPLHEALMAACGVFVEGVHAGSAPAGVAREILQQLVAPGGNSGFMLLMADMLTAFLHASSNNPSLLAEPRRDPLADGPSPTYNQRHRVRRVASMITPAAVPAGGAARAARAPTTGPSMQAQAGGLGEGGQAQPNGVQTDFTPYAARAAAGASMGGLYNLLAQPPPGTASPTPQPSRSPSRSPSRRRSFHQQLTLTHLAPTQHTSSSPQSSPIATAASGVSIPTLDLRLGEGVQQDGWGSGACTPTLVSAASLARSSSLNAKSVSWGDMDSELDLNEALVSQISRAGALVTLQVLSELNEVGVVSRVLSAWVALVWGHCCPQLPHPCAPRPHLLPQCV